MKETIYFCDFDGTIALKDIGNELHKRFSSPQWLTPNKAYLTGKITSRDCLWSQYEFFRGRREEVEAFVLEHEIDVTFRDFVCWTREYDRRVFILSDGLGFYIQLYWKNTALRG
jgi:2-hydroxy-3-keto-5-methylthiopentenyl-1-phosphate phosphatase